MLQSNLELLVAKVATLTALELALKTPRDRIPAPERELVLVPGLGFRQDSVLEAGHREKDIGHAVLFHHIPLIELQLNLEVVH